MKPIIEVKWVDSELYSNPWPSDWGDDIGEVTTIGYLVKETEKTLTLAMSIDDEGEPGGIFKIPKVTIKSRKEYGNKGTE